MPGNRSMTIYRFVLIMMVFGASGGGGTSPESAYWAVVAFALLFPSLFLLALKRLFLLILGIRTARPRGSIRLW